MLFTGFGALGMFDVAAISSSGSIFSVALGSLSTQKADGRLLLASMLQHF
jgi:hypothetical protein